MRRVGVLGIVTLIMGIGLGLLVGGSPSVLATSQTSPLTEYLPFITWQTAPSEILTAEEEKGLLYMREEEKLARDVYLTLYNKWRIPVFQNISRAEQVHMDRVKDLLDRYHIPDPAADKDVGEFTNQHIQDLYETLVAKGEQSSADALYVGATIEEVDIVDLIDWLEKTNKPAIEVVYQQLMCGSGNHLRAFVPLWESVTGQTYHPQYLTQEQYDEIMSGSHGACGGGGQILP